MKIKELVDYIAMVEWMHPGWSSKMEVEVSCEGEFLKVKMAILESAPDFEPGDLIIEVAKFENRPNEFVAVEP